MKTNNLIMALLAAAVVYLWYKGKRAEQVFKTAAVTPAPAPATPMQPQTVYIQVPGPTVYKSTEVKVPYYVPRTAPELLAKSIAAANTQSSFTLARRPKTPFIQ